MGRFQRLARIAVSLSALTDATEIYPVIVDGARDMSEMDSAALCRHAPEKGWSVAHAAGPLAEPLAAWDADELDIIAGWVDAGTSSHFPGDFDDPPLGYEFLLRAGVRAVMVNPLVVGKHVTGLMITANTTPRAHNPMVGAALEVLAAQAAACLGMAGAIEELSQRARQDPLTGVGNAAAFSDELAASIRAASAVAAGSCLMIDLDRFKDVNDTQGHPAGDELLRALTTAFAAVLRRGDGLYRIGGDEFAALLPRATAADTDAIATRLLEAARGVGTTVSIGTARILPGATAEQIRHDADNALYRAKDAGRDQWVATTAAVPDGAAT